MSTGRLMEMGEIVTVDDDGSRTKWPRALLITFDSEQECRDAIMADGCEFTFGNPDPCEEALDALEEQEARGQTRMEGI